MIIDGIKISTEIVEKAKYDEAKGLGFVTSSVTSKELGEKVYVVTDATAEGFYDELSNELQRACQLSGSALRIQRNLSTLVNPIADSESSKRKALVEGLKVQAMSGDKGAIALLASVGITI